MPIMSASASFTRYRLVDEATDQLLREVPERLKKNALKSEAISREAAELENLARKLKELAGAFAHLGESRQEP